jgi:hypothetical protein
MAAENAGVSAADTDEIVGEYQDAQLLALKTGLLFTGLLACLAFLSTGGLPARAGPPEAAAPEPRPAPVAAAA